MIIKIKKVALFIVLAMAGVFLTLAISMPGYPYAITKEKLYEYGKWYRMQETNELGSVNKYVFAVNEDKMMLYFSSMDGGKIIAVGLKNSDSTFGNKPPVYKSRLCCWHEVDFIFEELYGRILLHKQDWIWAIGENQKIETTMVKDVLENNEVKFQYKHQDGRTIETRFKFDSSDLMNQLRWLVDDDKLEINY